MAEAGAAGLGCSNGPACESVVGVRSGLGGCSCDHGCAMNSSIVERLSGSTQSRWVIRSFAATVSTITSIAHAHEALMSSHHGERKV